MMNEQLTMLKCKSNCISHKNFLCCASKPNLTQKNCAHALCGMNPNPHAKMSMMFNNMLDIKLINKGSCTSCICCIRVWNLSHLNSTFFFNRSRAFFSFYFCFACELLKIWTSIKVWSCHLGPLRWIYGHLNLPNYIQRPCVWSKCLGNNHLAT